MDVQEAWVFIRDSLPDNAGYDGSEYEEREEYITQFYAAIDVLNEHLLEA